MSKKAIIVELRPRWSVLREQKIYTEAEVLDMLCAFAQSIFPDEDEVRLREIIIDGFFSEENV